MSKISATEAARLLGAPRRTVLYWLSTGRLPSEKLTGYRGQYVVDTADVDALIAERRQVSA